MKGHLTPQRERFAQEVAKHGNQSEAHRVAFPKSRKWRGEAVAQAASHMMDDAKVSARVATLRAAAEKKLGITREQWLSGIAKETKNKAWKCRLTSFDMLGKALGYFAPEKHAHEVSGDILHSVKVIGLEARISAVIATTATQPHTVTATEVKRIEGGKS